MSAGLRKFGGIALVLAVLQAANFGLSEWLDPYLLQILIEIGIAIILAVSLNLINGFTGQFSLGHAGFMAVGAYTSAAITFYYAPALVGAVEALGVGPVVAKNVVFIGVLIVAALAAAIAGLIVGLPSLRLRGDYLAIATLGFGEIIRLIINNRPEVGGASGFTPMVPADQIPQFVNLFWVYLFVVITIVLSANLVRSAHGRYLLAIRDDETAAQVMGVAITYYKVAAFMLGAALAGVAGCLFGHYRLGLHPNDYDLIYSVMIVVMVVLGGMGSITGCTIAAIIYTLLLYMLRSTGGIIAGFLLSAAALAALALAGRRLSRSAKWGIGAALVVGLGLALVRTQDLLSARVPELRMLLFSGMLIILMLTRPQGLMGSRELNLGARVRRWWPDKGEGRGAL